MTVAAQQEGRRLASPDGSAALDTLDLEVLQGHWTEAQYVRLTDHLRRLLEFTDGRLEVLPMPTDQHQSISRFLFLALFSFVQDRGGTVLHAPLRLRLRNGKFREPDLLLVRNAEDARSGDRFWTGADAVVEVVSPDGPERDLVHKRGDYAEAAIPEYWVVDPRTETVTVFKLEDGRYVESGVYDRHARATSAILPGFGVDVGDVFDAAGER